LCYNDDESSNHHRQCLRQWSRALLRDAAGRLMMLPGDACAGQAAWMCSEPEGAQMPSRPARIVAALAAATVVAAAAAGQPAHAAAPVQASPTALTTVGFDPSLALLPIGAMEKINTLQAEADRAARGKTRAATMAAPGAAALAAAVAPLAYPEREPATTFGDNDDAATAERLTGFGTARSKNPKAVVNGALAEEDAPALPQADEDNGSIPLAIDTQLTDIRSVVQYPGVIGDGPHGSTGTATGDFDFYKLTAAAGTPLAIDVSVTGQ
jgi:hypothetical protein